MSETAGLSAPARALAPTAAYWAAMFAASALGTNLGDYWADALGLGLPASLASLAVFSVALIAADRLWGRGMEIFFWIALVVLRAMATNIGDSLSDDMGLARTITAPALAVLTLAAGWLTVGERSPLVDARYWIAMALGGAFGTVAGDLTSHTVGLPVASVALTALLVVGVAGRSTMAGASILSYWAIVLIERAAGTPVGDWLAEKRGLGLGLPIAMAITGGVFVAALAWRAWRPGTDAVTVPAPVR